MEQALNTNIATQYAVNIALLLSQFKFLNLLLKKGGVDIAFIMRVFKQFNFTSKNNPEDNFCYALSVAINGDSK